jgi:phosphoglucomutase
VNWEGGAAHLELRGTPLEEANTKLLQAVRVYPEVIAKQHDLKIVYTPIHGTGITLVPKVLAAYGFTNVHIVEEQSIPDGNFPTVHYPNPEETETMSIGLQKAKALDADIILGTDPDADRVGVGVKNHKGDWVLMNGNQTAVLAFAYMMEARKAKGIAKSNDMVITTIVTTAMINEVAKQNKVNCYNVLTGFKWVAELVKEKEGKENYIIGGEESFGLMIGDQIRDKDAVSAVAILCEMAAYEKAKGSNLFNKLIELYIQYGFYYENLISITKKGMNGQAEIAKMMEDYRQSPPTMIDGEAVTTLLDYELQVGKNLETGETWKIQLPKSNVLQFITANGTKISARPSGTEPKIKFYFSVNTKLKDKASFDTTYQMLKDKIKAIISSMQLN